MLSYHNNPQLKVDAIARAEAHIATDQLMAGQYWGDGKGYSIGCHNHDLGLEPGDHAALADAYGWPEWLVHLQDRIFEGLPEGDRPWWHRSLVSAVPVGADLKPAYHRIMSRMLRGGWRATHNSDPWGVAEAIDRVADLHDERCDDPECWARAAESAAESASRSAAWAAAESASRSAAWAAAESARSAWSAAESARSAWSAARAAEYRRIAEIVLEEVAR